jgi:tetratricopeptide (TPR) repeat protein
LYSRIFVLSANAFAQREEAERRYLSQNAEMLRFFDTEQRKYITLRAAFVGWSEGKEDYNRAITSFTVAIEAYPNYAVAYALRSIVYEETGNLTKAIDDLTQALVIDPDYQFAKDNLKRIRESQGN